MNRNRGHCEEHPPDEAGAEVFLGLDLGTCWSKVTAVDAAGRVLWREQQPTGTDYRAAGRVLVEQLARQQLGRVADPAVVTGEGRRHAGPELQRRTEISCLARVAHHLFARTLDVLDVGGRGSTTIRVSAEGRVQHFLQQRRCASGTAFFLEELARRLGLEPQRLAELATSGDPASRLKAECGLFAVSEAVERVRAGEPLADLCRAGLVSVTARLVEQGPLGEFVVLAGGVAEHYPLLGPLLAAACGARVEIPPQPAALGARGAAMVSRDTIAPS